MQKLLVTGASGQLAMCIKDLEVEYKDRVHFVFKSSSELDISNIQAVDREFESGNYQYCINCAAYTHVDKAEEYQTVANNVNRQGAKLLANACHVHNTILIHISTDFVFDGSQNTPHKEGDPTNPRSVYGLTKLHGEQEIVNICSKYFIFRTSWLYSEYGHNFMKSMIRFGKERDSLSVVYDQVGTPTYAKDLARVLLQLIVLGKEDYGIYHYSNEGVASWYDFAHAIFEIYDYTVALSPILTAQYPLPAKRPPYSVLDKTKVKKAMQIQIPHWRDSLLRANKAYQNQENLKH